MPGGPVSVFFDSEIHRYPCDLHLLPCSLTPSASRLHSCCLSPPFVLPSVPVTSSSLTSAPARSSVVSTSNIAALPIALGARSTQNATMQSSFPPGSPETAATSRSSLAPTKCSIHPNTSSSPSTPSVTATLRRPPIPPRSMARTSLPSTRTI